MLEWGLVWFLLVGFWLALLCVALVFLQNCYLYAAFTITVFLYVRLAFLSLTSGEAKTKQDNGAVMRYSVEKRNWPMYPSSSFLLSSSLPCCGALRHPLERRIFWRLGSFIRNFWKLLFAGAVYFPLVCRFSRWLAMYAGLLRFAVPKCLALHGCCWYLASFGRRIAELLFSAERPFALVVWWWQRRKGQACADGTAALGQCHCRPWTVSPLLTDTPGSVCLTWAESWCSLPGSSPFCYLWHFELDYNIFSWEIGCWGKTLLRAQSRNNFCKKCIENRKT